MSNAERLAHYKDGLLIVHTGKDSKGNSFSACGQLNAAAWIGENSGWLIKRIEELETELARRDEEATTADRPGLDN